MAYETEEEMKRAVVIAHRVAIVWTIIAVCLTLVSFFLVVLDK